METNNQYEVTEDDYKELETLFRKALTDSYTVAEGNQTVIDELESFIVTLGQDVKNILQKYHTDSKIKELEVKDAQEQLLSMKRKVVKMELQYIQIKNAINAFQKIKNS